MTKQYSKFHLPWLKDAKCAQDPDSLPDFFADSNDPDELDDESGKAVINYHCLNCPVMIDCLRYAVKNETLGIFGGYTADEREGLKDGEGILRY